MRKEEKSVYVRNIIFGVEDSLVATVGLLSGLATSGVDRKVILLTGVIYIVVEAFSMAVGSYLSEESAEESNTHSEVSTRLPVVGAVVMFVSFMLAGAVPIVPYLLTLGYAAVGLSIAASLVVLFILGFVSARVSGVRPWRKGLRLALIGGFAIVLGVLVGQAFGHL